MIVCSCNVLTDHDVRGTLAGHEVRRGPPAKFIVAWAAAPNADAAPAPSGASWMRRWPPRRPRCCRRREPAPELHAASRQLRIFQVKAPPFARPASNGYNQSQCRTSCGADSLQEHDHERRARSRRLPQQGTPARTDGDQPILAALPAARQLGLQGARQAMAQGIHRGDGACRQAGRAHHLPRRLSQHAGARSAAYRPERQGSPRLRPAGGDVVRARSTRKPPPIAMRSRITCRATCSRS